MGKQRAHRRNGNGTAANPSPTIQVLENSEDAVLVDGIITYWNRDRGFGFVRPNEGQIDIDSAFLHQTFMKEFRDVEYGPRSPITCYVDPKPEGDKGPKVTRVVSVMPSPAPKGMVRFYNQVKGYGFLIPNDGGKDIYFNRETLITSKLKGVEIEPGDEVFILETTDYSKGPLVTKFSLAR